MTNKGINPGAEAACQHTASLIVPFTNSSDIDETRCGVSATFAIVHAMESAERSVEGFREYRDAYALTHEYATKLAQYYSAMAAAKAAQCVYIAVAPWDKAVEEQLGEALGGEGEDEVRRLSRLHWMGQPLCEVIERVVSATEATAMGRFKRPERNAAPIKKWMQHKVMASDAAYTGAQQISRAAGNACYVQIAEQLLTLLQTAPAAAGQSLYIGTKH
jgi:hypothetical protein